MSRTAGSPGRDAAIDDGSRVVGAFDATQLWRLATGILGQTALLTALLLFFGWARTQATFAYFGVDLSLLDFSTTDYVLRSVNSAYSPLLMLGLAFLAGTVLHERLRRGVIGGWDAERIRKGVLLLGWALVVIGVVGLLWADWAQQIGSWVPDEPGLGFAWLPATLTAGFALLIYAGALPSRRDSRFRRDRNSLMAFALAGLVVMGLFWTVSLLAVHDGRARARAIERDASALAEVALLSRDVLAIQGPGVDSTPLGLRGSRYRRSYTGLRLLAHANGKYYLIPLAWRRGRDRVYAVPDDANTRIELIAH